MRVNSTATSKESLKPITIKTISMTNDMSVRCPVSTVLNPAVRAVTDRNNDSWDA